VDQHNNKILERIRRQERNLLKSISWISLGIAILYVCGYVWRSSYYYSIGIPVLMVDFPFPEILIPKMGLFIFIAQALFIIAYENYSDFFIKNKRLHRAKTMGIDEPIKMVHDYAMRPNSNSPDKANYQVVAEFLANYIETNSKNNPQWQFGRAEFDKKAIELFKDIPPELKGAFISYSMKICVMDKTELNQTINDVIGLPAKGSKIYEKMQMILSWLLPLLFIVAIIMRSQVMILSITYMVAGILIGHFLVKVSKVEARWQMWHSVLISVMAMLILNGIDGYAAARTEVEDGNLPIVKIIKTNGDEHKGLLLGNFNDGYIVTTSEPNDVYGYIKIHKQAVESISWTTRNKLLRKMKNLEKSLKELKNLPPPPRGVGKEEK
jgi:hypothetical protein